MGKIFACSLLLQLVYPVVRTARRALYNGFYTDYALACMLDGKTINILQKEGRKLANKAFWRKIVTLSNLRVQTHRRAFPLA